MRIVRKGEVVKDNAKALIDLKVTDNDDGTIIIEPLVKVPYNVLNERNKWIVLD